MAILVDAGPELPSEEQCAFNHSNEWVLVRLYWVLQLNQKK